MKNKQTILHFTGKGSAFNPCFGNTSAWFVYSDTFYLIDCGETVFEKIFQCEQMLQSSKITVFITHLHADHCGSLGSLLSFAALVLHKPVQIIYPSEKVKKLLGIMGINPGFYTHRHSLPKSSGVTVSSHSVKHVEDMKCFGYEIRYGNSHFYYSGDAYNIPESVLKDFLAGNIEFLFQDTNTNNNDHHCPLSHLETIIPVSERSRVYCMHLNTQNTSLYTDKGFSVV